MFGPTSAGVHATRPEHRADRPRLLLRRPRRGGVVRDPRRRAHARPPRATAPRAVRLTARARHAGHDDQPHACDRVLHLGVPRRHLRRALRRVRRFDQRHVVPGVQLAHDPRAGAARRRRSTVVRDHRGGGARADPRVRRRRRRQHLPPDAVRLRRHRRRPPGARIPPRCPLPVRRFLDRLGGRRPETPAAVAPTSEVVAPALSVVPSRDGEARHARARDRRPHRPVRRPGRGRRAEPRSAARSHHRAHRTQRRGQDHHVQRVLRAGATDQRAHPAPRSRRHAHGHRGARAPRPRPHVPEVRALAVAHGRAERRARTRGGDGGRQRRAPDRRHARATVRVVDEAVELGDRPHRHRVAAGSTGRPPHVR